MKELLYKMHYILTSKKTEYNATIFIRTLAISLISVFIPIFILDKSGPFLIIPYLLSTALLYPLALLLAYVAQKRFSVIVTLFLSLMFYVLGIYSLQLLTVLSVVGAAFFFKSAELIFWLPLHVEFTKVVAHEKTKSFAIVIAITTLTPFLGPLVGAFIIDLFGYSSLFIASLAIYLSMVLPQSLLHLKKEELNINKVSFSLVPAYIVEGIQNLSLTVVWPAFLFYSLWTRDSIGLLFSTISLVGGVASIIVSKFIPKDRIAKLFKPTFISHSLSSLMRVSTTKLMAFGGGALGFLSYSFFKPRFMSMFYHKVAHRRSEVIKRELNIALGMAIVALTFTAISLLYNYTVAFMATIFLASLASLYMGTLFKKL
ncbi:MAG: hypothetical protein D6769_00665 [Methanobacteriota archaeon]|nr:MAG: hypothetical protein D6769_00665 [Euryarchaeota archaeon]